MMKWTNAKRAAAAGMLLAAVGTVLAMYEVTAEGAWPADWPEALEGLRKEARTLHHHAQAVHEIPFADREEFEAAWPHIVKLKSKGAPITLLAAPNKRLGTELKVGVRIVTPRTGCHVAPNGALYPPGAEDAVKGGKFLKIGPPWPAEIRSASGTLPEFVVSRGGKWVRYNQDDSGERYARRARIELELIVDGEVVDLNRIALPAETLIIDKRFPDGAGE